MKKKNLKKPIILNIPYIVIGLVATNIGEMEEFSAEMSAEPVMCVAEAGGAYGR